jgi:hypothetical protein
VYFLVNLAVLGFKDEKAFVAVLLKDPPRPLDEIVCLR